MRLDSLHKRIQEKERENMKFIEILCKRYNISASDAAKSASQLKSDLMAFKTEEQLIKFLESLGKEAIERKIKCKNCLKKA